MVRKVEFRHRGANTTNLSSTFGVPIFCVIICSCSPLVLPSEGELSPTEQSCQVRTIHAQSTLADIIYRITLAYLHKKNWNFIRNTPQLRERGEISIPLCQLLREFYPGPSRYDLHSAIDYQCCHVFNTTYRRYKNIQADMKISLTYKDAFLYLFAITNRTSVKIIKNFYNIYRQK